MCFIVPDNYMGRHDEWRKVAKKCRRSRLRQIKAKKKYEEEQRKLHSPSYSVWLKEQEALELFSRVEEDRIREENNKMWIEREIKAQEEWKRVQEKVVMFKAEKAKQEIKIREEWEKEKNRIKEIEEKNKREKEEKEKQQEEFKRKVQDFIDGKCDEPPSQFSQPLQTNPEKEICPFYSKVGACRFFDNCSRNHIKTSLSRTLVMSGLFTHFGMDNKGVKEYDTDVSLEFDEGDMHQDFLEFYEDILFELRSYGHVTQFKVCCNTSPHLKGNVYASYSSQRESLKAYFALSGRFYGSKVINVRFCDIPEWKKAICGLFLKKRCPKGGTCNFLHVFQNPTSEFYRADMDCSEVVEPKTNRKSSSWGWDSNSDSDTDQYSTKNPRDRSDHNRYDQDHHRRYGTRYHRDKRKSSSHRSKHSTFSFKDSEKNQSTNNKQKLRRNRNKSKYRLSRSKDRSKSKDRIRRRRSQSEESNAGSESKKKIRSGRSKSGERNRGSEHRNKSKERMRGSKDRSKSKDRI